MRTLVTLVLSAALGCAAREPAMTVEQLRAVPDVTGREVRDAIREIESAGFGVELLPSGRSPSPVGTQGCASGSVVRQDPGAGTRALKGRAVSLTVSGCR